MSPRKLTNLVIRGVALVNAGANQHAKVLISKRAPQPTDTLLTPELRSALAKLDAKRAAARNELDDYYRLFPEDNMSQDRTCVEKVQKTFVNGGPLSPTDAWGGAEEMGEMEYRRDPTLTREQALAKVLLSPIFPFRQPGPSNPTWAEVCSAVDKAGNRTPEQRTAILKAASDEAAAWGRIEAVADRLQHADSKMTRPAAIAKALLEPEGSKAYSEYTAAQAKARRIEGAV